MEANNDTYDRFSQIINELENLRYALNMPIDDRIHVQCLRNALPEKIEALKIVYIQITGEDLWDMCPYF